MAGGAGEGTGRASSDGDGSALTLLEEAIEAHGGRGVWESAREVAVDMSTGGLAFSSKFQGRALRGVEAVVSTTRQRTLFTPFPRPGHSGVFDSGAVRIESADGEVLIERGNARAAFRDLRHVVWWDALDILYFAGYALWTYLSAPFVFTRPGYGLRELQPWEEGEETWRRLAVAFPEDVHTHSREQVFYVDGAGVLRRHDYTAEPFGSWARAAHYLREPRRFDGLLVPTRREVFPRRRDNRPRPHPRLVWIEIDDVRLIR